MLLLNTFKKCYMGSVNITPNLVYGIHNPVGLKYLSLLLARKYQHNFGDTTTKFCSCSNNVPETTEHYLLYCPTFLYYKICAFRTTLTLYQSLSTNLAFLYL